MAQVTMSFYREHRASKLSIAVIDSFSAGRVSGIERKRRLKAGEPA